MIDQMVALARTVVHPGTVLVPTVLLAVALVPLAWVVVRRLGGYGSAAGAAVLALIGVADVTVLRPGLLHAHADWSRVATACVVTDPGSLGAETALNIALFVPFAFLAVLALRRWLAAAIGVVAVVSAAGALSLGIEAIQAAYGIGACDSSDVVHNVIGAGLGAIAGLLAVGVLSAIRGSVATDVEDQADREQRYHDHCGDDGQDVVAEEALGQKHGAHP
jgi:hypothetical protein